MLLDSTDILGPSVKDEDTTVALPMYPLENPAADLSMFSPYLLCSFGKVRGSAH